MKQLTTEQMRQLLDRYPEMSAANRHVILTGQCVFTDADGVSYRAPLTQVDEGPTHYARLPLVAIDGKETYQCNN